jgi:cytochrome c peroxidase
MLFLTLAACGDNLDLYDGFTPAEWEVIETLSPLPDPPRDPTNRVADDPRAAVLGQKLFYDKRLSGPIYFDASVETDGALGVVGDENKYNCASCHNPDAGYIDNRSLPGTVSLGTGGWFARNTLTLSNAVYYRWSGWQGFIDTFWGHSILGIEVASAANGDRLRTAHLLWDKYRDEYNAIFDPDLDPALDPGAADAARFPPVGRPKASPMAPDGPYEGMTSEDQRYVTEVLVNAAKALAAYQRKLIRRNAPFDLYVAGDRAAISESAKRGLGLFVGKAGCVKCHEGPFFSDHKFHSIGVPQEGAHVPAMDTGRTQGILIIGFIKQWTSAGEWTDSSPSDSMLNGLVAEEADLGAFRTQGLRNVKDTGPYFHTGNFQTLRDVVQLYNEGGKEAGFEGMKDPLMVKLDLSDKEVDDLVAFLESLTGEKVPADIAADITPP